MELTNLTIKDLLTPYNFTDANDIDRVEWIVIHYYGALGTAKAVADFFYNAYRGASAGYALDAGPIVYRMVKDEDTAWHCGDGGRGNFKNLVRNSNSIGIEVGPFKLDPSTANSAAAQDWYFSDQTMENLVEFTKYLMALHNVPADHVVRHFDVTNKLCPRPFVGQDMNTYYGTCGDAQWLEFKRRLVGEDDDMDVSKMTEDQVTELWQKMMAPLSDNDQAEWAKKACDWAIEKGIFVGNGGTEVNYMWEKPISRQEMAILLFRFATNFGLKT